jgi:acyl-CoA thioester hydrolase
MIISTTTYRVTYADTDTMGVMYYGNYARLFEIARTETIRENGITYKEIEESGVMMPVAAMNIKYHRSIQYDELVTIESTIKELPTARMVFHHKVLNENGELATTAEVTLVFLDMKTNRPCRPPAMLLEYLKREGLS